MPRQESRFDAPFWAVVMVALVAIGVTSMTFLAFESADRVTELSQRIPT